MDSITYNKLVNKDKNINAEEVKISKYQREIDSLMQTLKKEFDKYQRNYSTENIARARKIYDKAVKVLYRNLDIAYCRALIERFCSYIKSEDNEKSNKQLEKHKKEINCARGYLDKLVSIPMLTEQKEDSFYDVNRDILELNAFLDLISVDFDRTNDSELIDIIKSTNEIIKQYNRLEKSVISDIKKTWNNFEGFFRGKSKKEMNINIITLFREFLLNGYYYENGAIISKEAYSNAKEKYSKISKHSSDKLNDRIKIIEIIEDYLSRIERIPKIVSYNGYEVSYEGVIEATSLVNKKLNNVLKDNKNRKAKQPDIFMETSQSLKTTEDENAIKKEIDLTNRIKREFELTKKMKMYNISVEMLEYAADFLYASGILDNPTLKGIDISKKEMIVNYIIQSNQNKEQILAKK